MTPLEISSRLEQRRRQLKISKKAVAARAQLSLPTVNRILSGREKRPTLLNIGAIAEALGVVIRIGATMGVDDVDDAFEYRKRQASAKARRLVSMVQGTMALEAQAVDDTTIHNMVEQTTCELLAGPAYKLWGD